MLNYLAEKAGSRANHSAGNNSGVVAKAIRPEAARVRDALIALGVERNRLETISYGSEVPLDPRSNEEAWALNRRVHFTPFTE